MQYDILEERNEGQDFRFYIYDFENEDTLKWFDSYEEASQYLEWLEGRPV